MKNVIVLTALGLVLLFVTGCPDRNRKDPSQTRYTETGSRPDYQYVEAEGVGGAPNVMLERRSAEFFGDDATMVEGVLPSVYYEFDESFIPAGERPKLEDAFNHLQNNPQEALLVRGYCDWRGTTEYNMALGDRRANAVKDFLIQLGISPDRIETVSKGDLEAEENAAESRMSEDRRADLVVVR